MGSGYALDGCVQVVERFIGDDRGKLRRHAGAWRVFVDDNHAVGFLNRLDDDLLVERRKTEHVDDFRIDTLFSERGGGLFADYRGIGHPDQRHVVSMLEISAFAEREFIRFVWREPDFVDQFLVVD